MIIVAGYELATAKGRDRYVDAFRDLVTRESDGCVHIAVTSTRDGRSAPLIRMCLPHAAR
jgi:hypothetical protein